MMKRILLTLTASALLLMAFGCSDDDDVVGPIVMPWADTSIQNVAGVWTTGVDATSEDTATGISFSELTDTSGLVARGWEMQFQRMVINLNSDSGVVGVDLGAVVVFDDVTISDTAGVTWVEDQYTSVFAKDWYVYDPSDHSITLNGRVYSGYDAGGENSYKFQVDSLVGVAGPGDMGMVWISYVYQATANSDDLSGTIVTASIDVGMGTGYFDFSTGTQVTPAEPSTSTGWDLVFNDYTIFQNCEQTGGGSGTAFPSYTQMIDGTDLSELATHPGGAQFFADYTSSVFNGSLVGDDVWYDYNGVTHTLTSKSHVYLVKIDETIYKLRIDGYYDENLVAAKYTLVWKAL